MILSYKVIGARSCGEAAHSRSDSVPGDRSRDVVGWDAGAEGGLPWRWHFSERMGSADHLS